MTAEFFDQFSHLWEGGYFEGDPRDPLGDNSYGVWGYHSALFTVYMGCIRPYVSPLTTALEIGPGRGAWSKTILESGANHLYAVDAAPADHTKFWEYVGRRPNVTYLVASDFTLQEVPDNSIDYFFSFGCFCHLKPDMCVDYIRSLSKKMRPGANGFLQFADFDKYNACLSKPDQLSLLRVIVRQPRKVWIPTRWAYALSWRYFRSRMDFPRVSKDASSNVTDAEGRGSLFHWGIDEAEEAIKSSGFEIVSMDVGAVSRDPICHFRKPAIASSR